LRMREPGRGPAIALDQFVKNTGSPETAV